jgi:hypothetical protein
MKLQLQDGRDLFIALGMKAAGSWTAERLSSRLAGGKLEELAEGSKLEDAAQKKLLKSLLAAIAAEKEIEVIDEVEADEDGDEEPEPVKPAKGKKDAKEPEAEEDEPKKPKEKGKAPPKKAEGGGVIGTIVEVLSKATAKKPISKAQIADVLAAKFPDRTREAMLKTVNVQVPTRLRKEKNLNIEKNENGYFVAVA